MKIIDDTYDGDKYPIVARSFNAYYFPENFNPDNMEEYSESLMLDIENQKNQNDKR